MLWPSFTPTPLSAGSGNDFDDSGQDSPGQTAVSGEDQRSLPKFGG